MPVTADRAEKACRAVLAPEQCEELGHLISLIDELGDVLAKCRLVDDDNDRTIVAFLRRKLAAAIQPDAANQGFLEAIRTGFEGLGLQVQALGDRLDPNPSLHQQVPRMSECPSKTWDFLLNKMPSLSMNNMAPCCKVMTGGLPTALATFKWEGGEDSGPMVNNMTKHLDAQVLPKGLFAWPVQRVGWLKVTMTFKDGSTLEIGPKEGRTDYILLLPEGRDCLQTLQAEQGNLCADDLQMILPFIVGLYEAKTSEALLGALQKSRRQAVLEYLVVNGMRDTAHKVVVVLGDGNTHHVVHPGLGPDDIHMAEPAIAILPRIPEGPAATSIQHEPPTSEAITLCFVRHVLAEARDVTINHLAKAQRGAADRSDSDDPSSPSSSREDGRPGGYDAESSSQDQAAPSRNIAPNHDGGSSNRGAEPLRRSSRHRGATSGPAEDEGLREAARDNVLAQAVMSVLDHPDMREGLGDVGRGYRLSFTPVTLDDYAASFKLLPNPSHGRAYAGSA